MSRGYRGLYEISDAVLQQDMTHELKYGSEE